MLYSSFGVHLEKIYMEIEHWTKLAYTPCMSMVVLGPQAQAMKLWKKITSSSVPDSMQVHSCSNKHRYTTIVSGLMGEI